MVGLLTSQRERDVAAYLIGLLVLSQPRACSDTPRSVSCGATTACRERRSRLGPDV